MSKYIFQWSEAESLLLVRCWAESYCNAGKFIGKELDVLGVVRQRVATTFVTQENVNSSLAFSKHYLEPEFQQKFLAMIGAAKSNFNSLFQEVHSTEFSSLTNEQLAELLERYRVCVADAMLPFIMMQAEFTDYPYKELKKELENAIGSNNIDQNIGLLLAPDKLDVIKREELAFSKLADNSSDAALAKHAYDYAVLFYNSYSLEENVEFLKLRLTSVRPYNEFKAQLNEEIAQRRKLQAEIESKLSTKTKRTAWFLRELAWERLELKDKWAGAEFRFASLFKEIAKRMQVALVDVFYVYSIPELVAYLIRGDFVPSGELSQRRRLYVVTGKAGEVEVHSGEAAKEIVSNSVKEHFSVSESRELKGAVANPGKVTGRARVVKVVGITELMRDMQLFQDGEILITSMTQPNMVPLVRKAAAMVTDEGGMTSHAAVISREFGVPCIVGTHIATKAIKTGDLIEVDANKGIVRKL